MSCLDNKMGMPQKEIADFVTVTARPAVVFDIWIIIWYTYCIQVP
jgi:hypothetical protein